MFGSGMNYVTMRLLGVPKDDARIVKARNWIQRNGTCRNNDNSLLIHYSMRD
jgi:hypothetical protein